MSLVSVSGNQMCVINEAMNSYKNLKKSKEVSRLSCSVISDSHCNMVRIPDGLSNFTAEAKAVDLPVYLIRIYGNN